MGLDIRKIRSRFTERSSSRRAEKANQTDLPLDHQLSFDPDENEHWKYKEGRVFVNGEDVNELVNENGADVGLLSGLSFGLDRYQRYVWMRGGGGESKFNGAVGALQGKIIGKLGSIYEGLVGGVRYEFNEEQFWLNNINVRAVLALYRVRPTMQARTYLRGLRDKLFLIIARSGSSSRADGAHRIVNNLIVEIEMVLKFHSPPDIPLLVADNRDRCEHVD